METLIDHQLVEQAPTKDYDLLGDDFESGYFAGYIIKNHYDEQRFSINKKYDPQRICFKTNNSTYNLYGVVKQSEITDLFINQLTVTPPGNIGEYCSALTLNGMSCYTCFLHFSPGVYPIDSTYMKRIFTNLEIEDFNAKKNIPSFQRIGHIYLFALVNHTYSS